MGRRWTGRDRKGWGRDGLREGRGCFTRGLGLRDGCLGWTGKGRKRCSKDRVGEGRDLM